MANTIFQSLFWSLNKYEVFSWGVGQLTALYYNDMPSLRFKVNGLQHKGFVLVSYDEGADYFVVYLLDKAMKVVKKMESVAADELGRRIDEVVEKPAKMDEDAYRGKWLAETACTV